MALIDAWVRWRGLAAPDLGAPITVERNWSYKPSRIGHYTRTLRLAAVTRRCRFPDHATIKPVFAALRWSLYFVYLPDGRITPAHRYTMERLRNDAKLLVVLASPRRDPALEDEIGAIADALIWKDLPGFDFSAYRLGLEAVAQASPGASLFVMNDSVFGPFDDPEALVATTQWGLTGFTASSRIENHIQSYAFHLKTVTPDIVAALRPALPQSYAYGRYVDVIYLQETRLARVATRRLSVGALWYADHPLGDPSLYAATALAAEGFPFIKRKLTTEHRHLHPRDEIEALLRRHGHPL